MATEKETLSDHEYIEFSVAAIPREAMARRREAREEKKRWALKKLDQDAFMASIHGALMCRGGAMEERILEGKLDWILGTMTDACNASMPRSSARPPKKTYWWSDELA